VKNVMFVLATESLDVDDRRVLLAITVEIEDGCVEHIQLKEGDSAEAVAMKFCRDHALPEQFVAPLTEHIVSNIISIRCQLICCTLTVNVSNINVRSQDLVFSCTKFTQCLTHVCLSNFFPFAAKRIATLYSILKSNLCLIARIRLCMVALLIAR
jgi:hypothetical protein